MSSPPFHDMPFQQRACVVGLVLILHLMPAWLLLGDGRPDTPSSLDMPPVSVVLLQSGVSAPAADKTSSRATNKAPSQAKSSAEPVALPTAPALAPVTASPASTAPAATPSPPSATPPSTSIAAQTRTGADASASSRDNAATLVSGSCAKPQYPAASRRLEEEGTVTLRFRVEADGQVSQSEVQNSSGFKRLDEAARDALSRCRFSPAMSQGQATASWATMRYSWRLE